MTIAEYRKRHKRCRTCRHTKAYPGIGWDCIAKCKRHYTDLHRLAVKGILCPLYIPLEEPEEGRA